MHCGQFTQVTGGSSRLVLYNEECPGQPVRTGYVIPIANESLQTGTSKNQRSVITGKRGAGKPFRGLPSPSGQVAMGASSPHMGLIFRAMCGTTAATKETPLALSAGAVKDNKDGTVTLAAENSPFVPGDLISVYGTINYDGTYVLAKGSGADALVFTAPFVAETPSDAHATRGRACDIRGDAVDRGDGKVALPLLPGGSEIWLPQDLASGVPHVFRPGDSVTISGTTNYDGEHVIDSVGAAEIVITAAYTAETFDAGLAVPVFYRHEWQLPKRQPTQTWEKFFDFDEDAASSPYRRYSYCKVNGISFDAGGDGEFLLTIDVASGGETGSSSALDADPVELPQVFIDKPDLSLFINGVRRGDVATASFSASFGITPQNAIGDRLQYTRMPEGDPEVSLSMSAYLESDALQDIADADTTVPVRIYGAGLEGDAFAVDMPECVLDTPGAAISGKEGLMQDVTAMAFVDKGESVLGFTLINRIAEYA